MAKARILIVDDDPGLRESLGILLEEFGLEVVGATDGEDARERLSATSFDVMISDIRMPRLNGIDLVRWSQAHRPIPTILITGFVDTEEARQAKNIGANAFLTKPFVLDDLLKALDSCLGTAFVESR